MGEIKEKSTLNVSKKIVLPLVLLILVLVIGTSYALWQMTFRQTSTNAITTGCFKLEFQDENPINLGDALPIRDEDGKKLTPYTVKVTNTCDTLVKYQVNLDILNTTTLSDHSYIREQFDDNEPTTLSDLEEVPTTIENASISYNLETGVLSKLGTKTFNLRLWMNETTPSTTDAMNKTFASKVVINTIRETAYYTEDILNGADPVLKGDLIPVTIEANGDVKRADTSKEWYNYENKNWANAVILKDRATSYASGARIPESNIESYFVWIPRYRYKIFNDTKYSGLSTNIDNTKIQTIEVEFETKDVIASTGTKKNEWLTHPAFTSFNTNGMWVGKFETSKSNKAPDNSRNAEGVQIKPNVSSWRNIQIGNAFYTSFYYQRNLDSHMMKNSEWGAVAYLQHSKYGSSTSVRINNNSNFITGYASVKIPTCGYTGDNRDCNKYGTTSDVTLPYNTSTGYLASTTGNITGIYDMSGGTWEYVMGVMLGTNGMPLSGRNANTNSGFAGPYGEGGSLESGYEWPNDVYYDKYAYGTGAVEWTNYSNGHLGDATVEMGPFKNITYANNITRQIGSWYYACSYSISPADSFFSRSGGYDSGTEGSLFTFGSNSGQMVDTSSFRVVLNVL